jgi:hypothetical protein
MSVKLCNRSRSVGSSVVRTLHRTSAYDANPPMTPSSRYSPERRSSLRSLAWRGIRSRSLRYQHEHAAATNVEKKLAAVLGVRWATYDRDTDRLYDTVKAALHAPD